MPQVNKILHLRPALLAISPYTKTEKGLETRCATISEGSKNKMSFLFSSPKAPKAVPTDTVIPLHFFDDSPIFRRLVLYNMLFFDVVLDIDHLRGSLERLIQRDTWKKLGGRVRRHVSVSEIIRMEPGSNIPNRVKESLHTTSHWSLPRNDRRSVSPTSDMRYPRGTTRWRHASPNLATSPRSLATLMSSPNLSAGPTVHQVSTTTYTRTGPSWVSTSSRSTMPP